MTETLHYDIELTRVFGAAREDVHRAFTDPERFARWYGPAGFPVSRDGIALEPRAGGQLRFAMVAEVDPTMRTTFDGRFTEVSPDLITASGKWDGIPGQDRPWVSHLRVELTEDRTGTRLVLREGPHPDGSADLGQMAWETMFAKLEQVLTDSA